MGPFYPLGAQTTYINYGNYPVTPDEGGGGGRSDPGFLARNKFVRFTQLLLGCATVIESLQAFIIGKATPDDLTFAFGSDDRFTKLNIVWISLIVSFSLFFMLGLIIHSDNIDIITSGLIMTIDATIVAWIILHLVGSILYSTCNQDSIWCVWYLFASYHITIIGGTSFILVIHLWFTKL